MKTMLLTLLFSTSVFSATSGTLTLTGTVPKKVSIVVTPETVASTLDLETTATDLKVATVETKSNVTAGYTVTVTSLNSSKLVHTTVSSQYVNYTLKLDTTSITFGTPISFTGKGTVSRDVSISYTGIDPSVYDNGTYTDTVTFTIAAN